jgi:hypothetical protein
MSVLVSIATVPLRHNNDRLNKFTYKRCHTIRNHSQLDLRAVQIVPHCIEVSKVSFKQLNHFIISLLTNMEVSEQKDACDIQELDDNDFVEDGFGLSRDGQAFFNRSHYFEQPNTESIDDTDHDTGKNDNHR